MEAIISEGRDIIQTSLSLEVSQPSALSESNATPHRIVTLPTELILLIVSWRVFDSDRSLQQDLRSLCLASSVLGAAARPHIFKVITIANSARLSSLVAQLARHLKRRNAVRAAWWGPSFEIPRYLRGIELPNMEHVAWVSYLASIERDTGPTGYHCAIRGSGAATSSAALRPLKADPLKIACAVPYAAHPWALVQEQKTVSMPSPSMSVAIAALPAPKSEIWALHIVTPLGRRLKHSLCHMMKAVPTITHLAITRYAPRRTCPSQQDYESSILVRILLCQDSFPQLQSLIIRDSLSLDDNAVLKLRHENDRIALQLQDSRLRFEEIPGNFNWSNSIDVVSKYTRWQWEEAVYYGRGPWGCL